MRIRRDLEEGEEVDCGGGLVVLVLMVHTHWDGLVQEAREPVLYQGRVALLLVVGAGKAAEVAHVTMHGAKVGRAVQHMRESVLLH